MQEKTVSINALIERALKKNWNSPSLTDMGGISHQYKDVAENIAKLHILFESCGLHPGDRVAICGKNSANWAVTFLACLTAGIVAVPLLHEFKPETIHHLVNHSEAKLLFVDAQIWEQLDENELPDIIAAIYISEFGMPLSRSKKLTEARNNLNERFGKKYPYSFESKDIDYFQDSPDALSVINYTSGSTGQSKGVMLSVRNIWSNLRFCLDHLEWLKPGDGVVVMLPLGHLYGMVIDMLHNFCRGCHVNFLTRVPSPKVILDAFAKVRPKLIITVPLIIEKIIKTKVFPLLEKPMMKFLLKLPFVDDKLLEKVKSNLIQAFGGNVVEIIIGGAPLNVEVEKFLYRIGFPVTVGYGMTECGPLITYAPHTDSRPATVGRVTDRMECRIDSPDPTTIPGNLWVKGDNVMLGYYKNEEATKEVMPEDDGWMNTGDMCLIDNDGFISICGRSKTMILGPSGQNIYPEEIEHKLNNLPYVAESLVIDHKGKLRALIVADEDLIEKESITEDKLNNIMEENLKQLNEMMPVYSKVSDFKIMDKEFEKTPKRSIKRFLYQNE